MIKGLDKMLIKESGLLVQILENPLLAVCMGTGMALEFIDKLKKGRHAYT